MITSKEKKLSPSRIRKTNIKRPRWKAPIEFESIIPAQIKEENRWNEEFIERISKSSYNKGYEAGKSKAIKQVLEETDKLEIKAKVSQKGQYKRGMMFVLEHIKSKLGEIAKWQPKKNIQMD